MIEKKLAKKKLSRGISLVLASTTGIPAEFAWNVRGGESICVHVEYKNSP